MALIACPECSSEVSDKAPACPRCGNPISTKPEINAIGTSLTTIQETSKRLKAHKLIAVGLMIIGVIVLVAHSPGTHSPVGGLLIVAGLVWYFVTRFRIWWNHK